MSPTPPATGEPAHSPTGSAHHGGGLATGWVEELAAGSVTTWTRWQQAHPSGAASASGAGPVVGPQYLPGAQQLELLRRLNEVAAATGRTVGPALADRVLRAGIPDRGRPDLPLTGLHAAAFGPEPVRPEALPERDLLPVAAGLIAESLASLAPLPPVRRPLARRLAGRVRPGPTWDGDGWVLLHRAPARVNPYRVDLALTDLHTLAVHAWATRAVRGGVLGFEDWLRSRVSADRLPTSLDVVGMAARNAERVGRAQVTLSFEPRHLPDLVGGAGLPPVHLPTIDLARQVGRPLGVLVSDATRTTLLSRRLLPRLRQLAGPTGPTPVPAPWAGHLNEHAERSVGLLQRAGYAVRGRLELLVPSTAPPAPPARPADSELTTLRLAMDLLLDTKDGAW
ncbi:hypothetical protein FXB39_06495 [Nocardioides sp. BGMRC 2183]|nr:hypothetical protein FXB39_06495 [Nocardioides sp. BGMRC 2183]